MSNFIDSQNAIGEAVMYAKAIGTSATPEQCLDIMYRISTHSFFLAECEAQIEQEYIKTYFALRNAGESQRDAELHAREKHPEKQLLKLLLNQGKQVLDTTRSHLSLLKTQLNQIETQT